MSDATRFSSIEIRPERGDDSERVFAVHRAAFGRANEAELVDVLRSSATPRLSLVAELEAAVVGHIFFSPVSVEGRKDGGASCAGLGPLGVLPSHQWLGIGSALVREGLRLCGELGWKAVFLVGDPRYYSRLGFTLAAPRSLHYGGEGFDPVFQLVELERGALAGARGQVRFHEAFERAETA